MPTAWEDRRGMFQSGKQVHEPLGKQMPDFGTRKASVGGIADSVRRSSTDSSNGLDKTMSGGSSGSPSRRRSSAASSGGALFSNLHQHKRGSQDYADRRASHHEQQPAGFVSGWFNSTFRGAQAKPDASAVSDK